MIIDDLEKKGFRVCITPVLEGGVWYWLAGVKIGDNNKATWVDSKNDLPFAYYPDYTSGLKAVLKYCESYKQKRKG